MAGAGAAARGELQGEISGSAERSLFPHCRTAPGDPRESQENETEPQVQGSWAPITDFCNPPPGRNGEGTELGSLEKAGGGGWQIFLLISASCQRSLWLLCSLHGQQRDQGGSPRR